MGSDPVRKRNESSPGFARLDEVAQPRRRSRPLGAEEADDLVARDDRPQWRGTHEPRVARPLPVERRGAEPGIARVPGDVADAPEKMARLVDHRRVVPAAEEGADAL